MAEPVQVKVGDEIAFDSRHNGYTIKKVLKITPTGIIKTDLYDMNPDLTIRGSGGSYSGAYRGEIVTDKIRHQVRRVRMLNYLSTIPKDKWDRLNTGCLQTIVDMIDAVIEQTNKEASREDQS